MFEATISLADSMPPVSLFGVRDQHLRAIRKTFGVDITYRDTEVRVAGEENTVAAAVDVLENLKRLAERFGPLSTDDVAQVLNRVAGDDEMPEAQAPVAVAATGRSIHPRTAGQALYVKAIREYDLTFAIGPSGTGKTYLAVALAVEALKQNVVRKIVLVRPAVEAGERLGYLPGDLQAKINPYLRPLLDALYEMMDFEQIKLHMEHDVIEVIPLAYMRGRTLNEAFIILDEAQNTTVSQMKMFLTRMGTGSKIVVAGDITQVDLPPHTRSGLRDAMARLKNIQGFADVHLSKADIVRHRLVQEIVSAYEEGTKKRRGTARR